MTEQELLKEIGINATGEKDESGSYIVDIKDYTEFGKFYSKLEHSEIVQEMPFTSLITVHTTDVTYQTTKEFEEKNSESFLVKIIADLDNDVYRLIVQKL